jgi:hypothetical protein
MKSAIIISSRRLEIDCLINAFDDLGEVHLQSAKRLVVEGAWGAFAIGLDEAEYSFSEEEMSSFRKALGTPFFAQLEYRNFRSADLAIERAPLNRETLIDNDNGAIRSVEQVRELIRIGSQWQTISDHA